MNYLENADLAAEVVADIESRGGNATALQAGVANEDSVRSLFDQLDECPGESVPAPH